MAREVDPFTDAMTNSVMYAYKQMTDRVLLSLDGKVKSVETVAKEAKEIGAWSRVVCENANLCNQLTKKKEVLSQKYFDYIEGLKHTKLLKAPPESEIMDKFLEIMEKDATLAYVEIPISRTFEVNLFGMLQKDGRTGRKFYEYPIPRDCDVIREITCSNDFEIIIGRWSHGKAEGDSILLIAAQYHEVKVKIYVDAANPDIVLSYIGTWFDQEHRKVLATSDWETKKAYYTSGTVHIILQS
jgi:hypothetical protein